MKKRNEWVTKHLKREAKKKDQGIADFIQVKEHFFPVFNQWIDEMRDPRHESYITYTQKDLVYLGIMKNACAIESMRQLNEKLNERTCIETLGFLSGSNELEELPDYTTLNNYLEKLSPKCLSDIRTKMIRHLIRGKAFHKNRLLGKYWVVILDGTGLFHFKEKHCEQCLVRTLTDEEGTKKRDYYHKVLEAKIILSDTLVLSLGTEFIENERESVSKQDCEQNAAKRLLSRLKKEYPRLEMCILGDGLYCVEPIMKLCREKKWKYLFNCKEGTQKNIVKDYRFICAVEPAQKQSCIAEESGTGRYANHVEEITGKEETFHIIEYEYIRKVKNQKVKTRFMWATNLKITERNLEELIRAGRKRWKIENEGFNNQKNGIYKIEHLNSRNTKGMKNHYLLTQITDIVMQLYLSCNRLLKEIKQSKKNTSSRLLESFRRQPITDEDVSHISKYTTVHLE